MLVQRRVSAAPLGHVTTVRFQLLLIGAPTSQPGLGRLTDALRRRGALTLGGQYKAVRRPSLDRASYGCHVPRLISVAEILY